MKSRYIQLVLALLFAAFVVFIFGCIILYDAICFPVPSAARKVKIAGKIYDWNLDSYTGDIISEPDSFGGCTVSIEFPDIKNVEGTGRVVVLLKRTHAFEDWQIVNLVYSD
jgi:hypothetical protein